MPDIVVKQVAEQPIVAVRQRTTIKRVSQDIQQLLNAAWSFIGSHRGLRHEHNVAIYWDDAGDGVVEVGVQVNSPFEDTDAVVLSATPAGTVAVLNFVGRYSDLRRAHEAVRAWCKQNGRRRAGPFWEVYGDPPADNDPAKYATDVMYLLE